MRRSRAAGITCVAVLSLWALAAAQAQTPKKNARAEPIGERTLGPEAIELHETTTWLVSKLVITDGTRITTNGYALTVIVNGDLDVQGTATIFSYEEATRSLHLAVPTRPAKGSDGLSHNRGPMTDGPGNSRHGEQGGHGALGTSGTPGLAGWDANQVNLVVNGSAKGKLVLINTGTDGQNGGEGGDGGNGGYGQQGGRAVQDWWGPCKSGPGWGGDGGNAGSGGPGGAGGQDGDGGDINIHVTANSPEFSVEADQRPGKPGSGGKGGQPGTPGQFGWGGRGCPGCNGKVEERRGNEGHAGSAGPAGSAGQSGTPGTTKANLTVKTIEWTAPQPGRPTPPGRPRDQRRASP